ncbi:hypothetical protein KCU95_g12660, partial [Aureobasidium melanogenum]
MDALDRREQDAQNDCEQKHEDLTAKYEAQDEQLIASQSRNTEGLETILTNMSELADLRTQLEHTKKQVGNLQGPLREARESAQHATSQHHQLTETSQASHRDAVFALNVEHANEVRVLNQQIESLNSKVAEMAKKESDVTRQILDLNNDLQERDKTVSSHVEYIGKLKEELKKSNTRVEGLKKDVERKQKDLHKHDEQQQNERKSLESTITELQGELGAALHHLGNIIAGPAIHCDQQKLRDAATTLPSTTLVDECTKDYHLDPQDVSTDWSLSMVSEHELLPYRHRPFSQLTTRLYLSAGVSHDHRAIQAILEVMLQKPDRFNFQDLPLMISLVHKLLEGIVGEDSAMFAVRVMELIIRVAKAHNYAWHNFPSLWQEWKPKVSPDTNWAKYMLLSAYVSWLVLWADAVHDTNNTTASVVPLSRIWMADSGVQAIDDHTLNHAMPELKSVVEKLSVGSSRSPRTLFANRVNSSATFYAIVDVQARWIVVYPQSEGEVDGDGLNTLPQRCRINGELSDVPDFVLPDHDMMFVARNMRVLSGRSLRLWRERKAAEEKRSQGMQ